MKLRLVFKNGFYHIQRKFLFFWLPYVDSDGYTFNYISQREMAETCFYKILVWEKEKRKFYFCKEEIVDDF